MTILKSSSGTLTAVATVATCMVLSCEAPRDEPPGLESIGEVSDAITLPPVDPGSIAQAPLVPVGCADGTVEQTFAGGIVGCAGAVTFPNRATLCGPGYHTLNAQTWKSSRGTTAPTHHYWTNDALSYGGFGSGNCTARYSAGTACPENQPMRVCASTPIDPEGNRCNWIHCALESGTNDFFGGCVGNTTAGTLCVPDSGCVDGSVEQTFTRGMVGCAGSVTLANAAQLCTAGYTLAQERDWLRFRAGGVPAHNYWTAEASTHYSGSSLACFATTNAADPSCPASTPMRVCVPSGTDPEGNRCNWTNCDSTSPLSTAANEYLGGCIGNTTAGALCVPSMGCADGTIEQQWNTFIIGCAGSVTFPNRDSLCGSRGIAVPIGVWPSAHGALVPTHNYWANQALLWNGSASGNCFVSQFTGFSCGMDQAMHICTPSGTDAEGNTCVWTQCGVDSATPNHFMGGCGTTAGTVCMTGP
ncbi:MAG TPA: hypothetical protein VGK73_25635 [Polyangiaceae bacterium]